MALSACVAGPETTYSSELKDIAITATQDRRALCVAHHLLTANKVEPFRLTDEL
jgi:hypothetical protein